MICKYFLPFCPYRLLIGHVFQLFWNSYSLFPSSLALMASLTLMQPPSIPWPVSSTKNTSPCSHNLLVGKSWFFSSEGQRNEKGSEDGQAVDIAQVSPSD